MKPASRHFIWLDQLLRIILGVVALGGVGLLLSLLWSPDIEALAPGDFNLLDQTNVAIEAAEFDQADEFVSRPLFIKGRRPLVASAKVPAPVAVREQLSTTAKALENVTLVGVFSAGDSEGVILLENGVDRRRVLVGGQTGDWTLASVEPRAAVFISGSAKSRVTMDLATIGQSVGGITLSARTNQDEDVSASEREAERAKAWVPTFDSILERKLRNRTKSGPDDSAETEGKNGAADTEKKGEL